MAIKSSDNKVLHERVEAANAVWLWYITCLPILFVFSLINLFLLWSSILRNVKLWCIHLHIAFLFFVLIWKFSSSVAFDEDFEAELAENHDARNEVSLLAKSPDPELTEVSYIIYKFYVVLYYLMVIWSASIIGVNRQKIAWKIVGFVLGVTCFWLLVLIQIEVMVPKLILDTSYILVNGINITLTYEKKLIFFHMMVAQLSFNFRC